MDFGEDNSADSLLDTPLEEEGGSSQGGVSGGKVKVNGLELDLQAMLSPDGLNVVKNVEGKSKNKSAPAVRENDQEDGPEDGSEQEESEEDGNEQDQEEEDDAEGKGGTETPKSGKQATVTAWAQPLQQALREEFGAEVTLPLKGTPKQVLEAIAEIYSQPDLHPEVARIQEYVDKGGKVEDYFHQISQTDRLLNLEDDKALMFEVYKNQYGKSEQRPKGLDDEKIKDMLSKKEAVGVLAIEAFQTREALEKQKANREQENATYARKGAIDPKDPQQVQKMQASIEANVRQVVKSNGGKLYGLDLSKAGSEDEFVRLGKYYFTPDQKGVTPYQRVMSGNGNMIKAMLLVHLAEQGYIDASLLEKANSGKRSILKRMPTQPRPAGGGKSGAPAFDIERAKRPEIFSGSSKA